MNTVYVAIVGPQFADPVNLVTYITFRYHIPLTRRWIFQDIHHHDPHATDADSILECAVKLEPERAFVLQAPVHAIWDLSRTYKYLLAHTDILIHMLCVAERDQRLNRRDFEILSSEYQQLSRNVPCITLLNDGGYGEQPTRKMVPEQVQALCLRACEPIVTTFQERNSGQKSEKDIEMIVEKLRVLSRGLPQNRPHALGYENVRQQHYSAQLTPEHQEWM